jgi:hypothetical protein
LKESESSPNQLWTDCGHLKERRNCSDFERSDEEAHPSLIYFRIEEFINFTIVPELNKQ